MGHRVVFFLSMASVVVSQFAIPALRSSIAVLSPRVASAPGVFARKLRALTRPGSLALRARVCRPFRETFRPDRASPPILTPLHIFARFLRGCTMRLQFVAVTLLA